MTPLIFARLIALVSTGLTAGIFLGHRAGVSRASTRLAPPTFIQLQQIIHETFERMMPPLVLAAVLSTLTWTMYLRVQGPLLAFWLLVAASLGLAISAGLTRAINIPINRQLMTWNSGGSRASRLSLRSGGWSTTAHRAVSAAPPTLLDQPQAFEQIPGAVLATSQRSAGWRTRPTGGARTGVHEPHPAA